MKLTPLLCLCLLSVAAVRAQVIPAAAVIPSPELSPVLRVADFNLPPLPPEARLDDVVPTDGFQGLFMVESRWGSFPARGTEMVRERLAEVPALMELDEVSRGREFGNAAATAAKKTGMAIVNVVTNPVETVKEIPAGVGRFFGKVARGVGNAVEGVSESVKRSERDEAARIQQERRPGWQVNDPLGFGAARRQWAARLKVDPYTTNPALAKKLDEMAGVTFLGGFAVDMTVGQVARPVSLVATVDSVVLEKSPADVAEINRARLQAMGFSKEDIAALLHNPAFSPTQQTRLVNALEGLRGVKGRGSFGPSAAAAASENEARFLCRAAEILARYHNGVAPLAEVLILGAIPAGIRGDLGVIVAAPVDVIAWTETVREFAQRDSFANVPHEVCVSGNVTPLARQGLTVTGWRIRENFLGM